MQNVKTSDFNLRLLFCRQRLMPLVQEGRMKTGQLIKMHKMEKSAKSSGKNYKG